MQARQIATVEGVLFNRQIVQAVAMLRVVAPGGIGGEEVEAAAETGFQDGEAFPALPALRKAVAMQEYMSCLAGAAVGGVVDVTVVFGDWRAVLGVCEAGGEEAVHGSIRNWWSATKGPL